MKHEVQSFHRVRCKVEVADGAFAVLLDHGGPVACARCLSETEMRSFVAKAEEAKSPDIAWLRECVDDELARRRA